MIESFDNSRENLINVFKEVQEDLRSGDYVNGNGELIKFEDARKMLNQTEKFKYIKFKTEDDRYYEDFDKTKIYVENIDFLDKACQFDSRYVAILNPASANRAGGGVRTGARALEEIICRRSNLIKSLEKFSDKTGLYSPSLEYYDSIWSPYVSIYRDSEYRPMNTPKKTNVISMAAINHPILTDDCKYTEQVEKQMKRKIRCVFRLAIEKRKIDLVLPAWGCGAFKNPASEVARCFKEVLAEHEFTGAFREICFAILDDHNSNHEFNPQGNFKPFCDMFNK